MAQAEFDALKKTVKSVMSSQRADLVRMEGVWATLQTCVVEAVDLPIHDRKDRSDRVEKTQSRSDTTKAVN